MYVCSSLVHGKIQNRVGDLVTTVREIVSESEVIGQELLLHCYVTTEKSSGLASDNTISDTDRKHTCSTPPCYRVVTFQPSCSDKSSQYYYLQLSFGHSWVGIAKSLWLWAGCSGDRISVEVRLSIPVQTDPGAHPAYRTVGTGSLSRG